MVYTNTHRVSELNIDKILDSDTMLLVIGKELNSGITSSIVIKAKDINKVNFSSYVVLIKDRFIVSNYDMLLTYINGKYRYNSKLTPYEINYIQNILNIERSK